MSLNCTGNHIEVDQFINISLNYLNVHRYPCYTSFHFMEIPGGGGGVQQQKRQRTSCDFPGGMIFFVVFCSLFEDILLSKSGKKNKKERKRTKKIKKDKNHDLFCSFFEDTFLTKCRVLELAFSNSTGLTLRYQIKWYTRSQDWRLDP